MNSNWFKIILKIEGVKYGKNLLLKGIPAIIRTNGSKLIIGKDVTLKSSFFSNLIGIYCRTIIVTRSINAEIKIGDHVGISGATIYARKSIQIGDNTMIGGNVKIIDNDFHPIEIYERHSQDKSKVKEAPVIIGKNCFIGVNALILKGTELGDNCVVGAGAVVAGKFEANTVLAGNPAKVIRKL
jgi:acetyltransferase-like isoleucine patch superfamily enzyme